jgi:glycerophosphoryl diester phosphodiesterase
VSITVKISMPSFLLRPIVTGLALLGPPAIAADAAPADGVFRSVGVQVTAHRGWLSPDQLENSPAQMARTTAAGPFMLEMDLKASHDGTVYLLHDDTLDRTTDGHGPLRDSADTRLGRLHLVGPAGRRSNETLPRFANLARWAAATSTARLMLDVKRLPPAAFMPWIERYRLGPRTVVLTFDPASAKAMLRYDREVLVSVLVQTPQDIATYRALAGQARLAMYVPGKAAPALFAAAHRSGATVISDAIMPQPGGSLDERAETGGDAVYADFLKNRPIDIFVTNHPQRVHKLLQAGIAH